MLIAIIDEMKDFKNKTRFYISFIERNQILEATSRIRTSSIANMFRGRILDLVIINAPSLPQNVIEVIKPCVIRRNGNLLITGYTGRYLV
jgi:hypothetical protein